MSLQYFENLKDHRMNFNKIVVWIAFCILASSGVVRAENSPFFGESSRLRGLGPFQLFVSDVNDSNALNKQAALISNIQKHLASLRIPIDTTGSKTVPRLLVTIAHQQNEYGVVCYAVQVQVARLVGVDTGHSKQDGAIVWQTLRVTSGGPVGPDAWNRVEQTVRASVTDFINAYKAANS